jgi:hypothetical protein
MTRSHLDALLTALDASPRTLRVRFIAAHEQVHGDPTPTPTPAIFFWMAGRRP